MPRETRDEENLRGNIVQEIERHSEYSTLDYLPIVHLTKPSGAKRILEEDSFLAKMCSNFNVACVYFFVGRADYAIPKKRFDDEFNQNCYDPVVFLIMNPYEDPYTCYPFDTGGWRYYNIENNRVFGEFSDIKRYCLGQDLKNISKFISKVFGGLENYILNKFGGTVDCKNGSTEPCLSEYVLLNRNAIDSRSSAIEIVYDKSIQLGDSIGFIIVEFRKLIPNSEIRNLIERKKIKFMGYQFNPAEQARDISSKINEIIMDLTSGEFSP